MLPNSKELLRTVAKNFQIEMTTEYRYVAELELSGHFYLKKVKIKKNDYGLDWSYLKVGTTIKRFIKKILIQYIYI